MSLIFGVVPYLLIQLGITLSPARWACGCFMQHQFEDVYWERRSEWDFTSAALQGSSYYKLPRILQWFTGNIGFHHIHHLCPRIPNYNLERCHQADPFFQQVNHYLPREPAEPGLSSVG
jgi:omega-6 fatty acid desaturase (delta-12 desaturase)